ncbi:hypothetical protein [Priestia endophytica]|uniref:hypothetical protein n=1 Tax=Priestia endophytica TaxID=135735 RepID=UPI002E2360B4|nr:hypothetical protein [Priestia endophytica]
MTHKHIKALMMIAILLIITGLFCMFSDVSLDYHTSLIVTGGITFGGGLFLVLFVLIYYCIAGVKAEYNQKNRNT